MRCSGSTVTPAAWHQLCMGRVEPTMADGCMPNGSSTRMHVSAAQKLARGSHLNHSARLVAEHALERAGAHVRPPAGQLGLASLAEGGLESHQEHGVGAVGRRGRRRRGAAAGWQQRVLVGGVSVDGGDWDLRGGSFLGCVSH